MAGGLVDADEQRWAEARSVLDRRPTPQAHRRQRRQAATTWVVVVAVLVFAGAVSAFLASLIFPSSPSPSAPVAGWRDDVGLAITAAGLLIETAGIIAIVRSGLWGARWRAPVAVLTRRQRRSLTRQVLGKVPPVPQRLPLARDFAETLSSSRVLIVLYAGVALLPVGNAMGEASTTRMLWALVPAALVVLGGVITERQARLADRFLRQHPASSAESEPGPLTT